jgi:hypothetical protein
MKPENDPNYETRLRDKINELMKGDYDPLDPSNLAEVLANLNEKQTFYLSDDLIEDRYEAAGIYINIIANSHWERLARIEAEARLAEEYMSCDCGGNGCSKCNDKGHDYD